MLNLLYYFLSLAELMESNILPEEETVSKGIPYALRLRQLNERSIYAGKLS